MFIFCEKNFRDHFECGGPQGCTAYDDYYYEGVFLKKIPTRLGISDETMFIVNEEDDYSFAASDILIKLPSPDCVRLFT